MGDRVAAARRLAEAVDRFQQLTAESGRHSERHLGMSSSALATFEAISLGAVKVNDVAAATRQHVSSASRAVDQLVTDGVVTRVQDPDDRRAVQLGLTRTGKELAQRMQELRLSTTEQMMAGFSNEEAMQFAELAVRMAEQAHLVFARDATD
jgi:DNA-binding MarR family transcriptional regulator